jgi:hypothetical protein
MEHICNGCNRLSSDVGAEQSFSVIGFAINELYAVVPWFRM